MYIGLAMVTPGDPTRDTFLWWMVPISWKSQRQDNVSLSTSEAEFVATNQVCQEVIYLRKTLTNFGVFQTPVTLLYADNTTCVAMSENPVRRKFSRHVDIRKYNVCELVLVWFLKVVPLRMYKIVDEDHTKSLPFLVSSGTARSWVVMLLLPFAYYIASPANFDCLIGTMFFSLFFSIDCLIFFSSLTLRQGFWVAFDYGFPLLSSYFFSSCFHNSLFFLVFPLLSLSNPATVHGVERYSAHKQDLPPRVKWGTPINKILSRISTFSLGPFRLNVPFGKSFLRSSWREVGELRPGDWKILCRAKKH